MTAVVVGRDGFVIESAVSGKVDIEALGAMASTGLGHSEAMGNTLGKGELSQMLVELEKGPIILSPLSADELIAIVADTSSNVGRTRVRTEEEQRTNRCCPLTPFFMKFPAGTDSGIIFSPQDEGFIRDLMAFVGAIEINRIRARVHPYGKREPDISLLPER